MLQISEEAPTEGRFIVLWSNQGVWHAATLRYNKSGALEEWDSTHEEWVEDDPHNCVGIPCPDASTIDHVLFLIS